MIVSSFYPRGSKLFIFYATGQHPLSIGIYNKCCTGIYGKPWVCAWVCVWILQNLPIGYTLKLIPKLFVIYLGFLLVDLPNLEKY
jgi:hypothetical protein